MADLMATTANVKTRSEAGRSGADVRSDLRVVFEPRDAGGIDVELRSRVAPYYGENVRQQARNVLEQLGVVHARLFIEDEGALPFVIAARIEAAVRRAGLGQGRRALPEAAPLPPPSVRDRLRRSRLYLPGTEPKYFINAALHEPDAIILDLEDAVHPAEKDAARLLVRNTLRAVEFRYPAAAASGCAAPERMVRINQLPLGNEDLDEVVPQNPDTVLIPKVEHAEQVKAVAERIAQIQNAGERHSARPIWLIPILESALGIENAFGIARASDRVVALSIGLEDYTADLGVPKTREGTESLYARLRLVNAAHAARVQASDSVYSDVADMEGLRTWAERSRALGFDGMSCIHPLQVPVIHEAFAPSPAEIEKALAIVAAFEEARARGVGVVSVGSKMIDAPVVERALKLVERARRMGRL